MLRRIPTPRSSFDVAEATRKYTFILRHTVVIIQQLLLLLLGSCPCSFPHSVSIRELSRGCTVLIIVSVCR